MIRMTEAVGQFLAKLATESPSKATLRNYKSDLEQFLKTPGYKDTVAHMSSTLLDRFFKAQHDLGLQPATIQRRRATLAEFLRYGIRNKLWGADLLEHLPRSRRPPRVPHPFTREEAARFLALSLPPREHMVRTILFYSGLRVSEVCGLLVGHITTNPPAIRTLRKGAQIKVLPMHPTLQAEIEAWVGERPDLKAHHYLISHKDGRPLRSQTVWKMTKRWGNCGQEQYHAGVERCEHCAQVAKSNPHRFRHTFATELLRATGELMLVKEAMGHASVATTQGYVEVLQADLEIAIPKLDFLKAKTRAD